MNKFRYIWLWTTVCQRLKWWADITIKKWETIETELPISYMVQNAFVLVQDEVDEVKTNIKSFTDSCESAINSKLNVYNNLVRKLEKEREEELKKLYDTYKSLSDWLKNKKNEWVESLNNSIKDWERVEEAKELLKDVKEIKVSWLDNVVSLIKDLVDETKVDETKVDETKVDKTKVDETKVDETKETDNLEELQKMYSDKFWKEPAPAYKNNIERLKSKVL